MRLVELWHDTVYYACRSSYDGTDEEIFKMLKNPIIKFDMYLKNVSNEAKDLIKKLLEVGTKKRISARQACLHPWIKAYSQEVSQHDISKVLLRIKSFRRTTKLREAIHTFIISKIMTLSFIKPNRQCLGFQTSTMTGLFLIQNWLTC